MRKHTKRKVWRLVNPIEHAIEAFRTGNATKHDWAKLVGMMNLTEHMASRGIGPEAIRHDLMRQSITLSEYERAITEVTQRVQSRAPEVYHALEA